MLGSTAEALDPADSSPKKDAHQRGSRHFCGEQPRLTRNCTVTAPQGAETPKICRLPDSTSSERSQCEALHKTTSLPELRTMNKSATAHGSANSSQSPMTPSHVAVTQSTAMLSHNLNLPTSNLDTSLLNPTVKLPSNCLQTAFKLPHVTKSQMT